jgi:hypothetical protein
LSGDHGVAPIPEYLQSKGIAAARLSYASVTAAASKALEARFGDGKWIQGFVNDQIYLDQKLIAEKKVNPAEAERIAGEAALEAPGVAGYITRTQIVEGRLPSGPIARRVANGFNRQRSGDVCVITRPFTFFAEESLATTHGSPYNYDTHVPVILSGAGIRAGRYHVECTPSDLAPTLSAILRVEMPSNRVGRVLVEAIRARTASSGDR